LWGEGGRGKKISGSRNWNSSAQLRPVLVFGAKGKRNHGQDPPKGSKITNIDIRGVLYLLNGVTTRKVTFKTIECVDNVTGEHVFYQSRFKGEDEEKGLNKKSIHGKGLVGRCRT